MQKSEAPVRKTKGGIYTKYRSLYVECLFETKILPIKMNLPMVVPPVPWGGLRENVHLDEKHPPSIFDCSRGYLSPPGGELLNRFRLITSKEYEKNFYIKWNGYEGL